MGHLGKWMLLWNVWVNGCYCGTFGKMYVTVESLGKWMLLWNIWVNGCYVEDLGKWVFLWTFG